MTGSGVVDATVIVATIGDAPFWVATNGSLITTSLAVPTPTLPTEQFHPECVASPAPKAVPQVTPEGTTGGFAGSRPKPSGINEDTVTPCASDSPSLCTRIVYTTGSPVAGNDDIDAVVDTDTSADVVNGVDSVAVLLLGTGSAVVAVAVAEKFRSGPVASARMTPEIHTVAVAPFDPRTNDAGKAPRSHTMGPLSVHDPRSVETVTFVRSVKYTFVSDTPAASDGPQLLTSTLYDTQLPATSGDGVTETTARTSALGAPITPVDLNELLLVTGSVVADDTLAVWEILAPAVAD